MVAERLLADMNDVCKKLALEEERDSMVARLDAFAVIVLPFLVNTHNKVFSSDKGVSSTAFQDAYDMAVQMECARSKCLKRLGLGDTANG